MIDGLLVGKIFGVASCFGLEEGATPRLGEACGDLSRSDVKLSPDERLEGAALVLEGGGDLGVAVVGLELGDDLLGDPF